MTESRNPPGATTPQASSGAPGATALPGAPTSCHRRDTASDTTAERVIPHSVARVSIRWTTTSDNRRFTALPILHLQRALYHKPQHSATICNTLQSYATLCNQHNLWPVGEYGTLSKPIGGHQYRPMLTPYPSNCRVTNSRCRRLGAAAASASWDTSTLLGYDYTSWYGYGQRPSPHRPRPHGLGLLGVWTDLLGYKYTPWGTDTPPGTDTASIPPPPASASRPRPPGGTGILKHPEQM